MRISDWSSDVCSSDLRAGCSQRIDVRPQRPSLCRLDRARCQAQQRILQGAVLAHVYRPDGGLISLKMRTLRHAAPAASFGGKVGGSDPRPLASSMTGTRSLATDRKTTRLNSRP